jgi:ribosomal protein S8E
MAFFKRQRSWRRKADAGTVRKQKAEGRASARKYLTGEKVRRWESPKMIAQHGRAPWPAKQAHDWELKRQIRNRLVGDKHGTDHVKMKERKGDRTKIRGWSLVKANVSRSKATGRFKKR